MRACQVACKGVAVKGPNVSCKRKVNGDTVSWHGENTKRSERDVPRATQRGAATCRGTLEAAMGGGGGGGLVVVRVGGEGGRREGSGATKTVCVYDQALRCVQSKLSTACSLQTHR